MLLVRNPSPRTRTCFEQGEHTIRCADGWLVRQNPILHSTISVERDWLGATGFMSHVARNREKRVNGSQPNLECQHDALRDHEPGPTHAFGCITPGSEAVD